MNKHNEVWGVQPLNDRLQRFAVVRQSDPGRGKSQVCTHVRNRREADLISACHEMYAALQALFYSGMEGALLGDGKDDQIEAIRLARAAMAKAEVGAQ